MFYQRSVKVEARLLFYCFPCLYSHLSSINLREMSLSTNQSPHTKPLTNDNVWIKDTINPRLSSENISCQGVKDDFGERNVKIYHFILLQGVIILDSNGESCDGDTSETEEDRLREARVEASNNFVFVGAEIRTGKSTIRSKQSKRKVSTQSGKQVDVQSLHRLFGA